MASREQNQCVASGEVWTVRHPATPCMTRAGCSACDPDLDLEFSINVNELDYLVEIGFDILNDTPKISDEGRV